MDSMPKVETLPKSGVKWTDRQWLTQCFVARFKPHTYCSTYNMNCVRANQNCNEINSLLCSDSILGIGHYM